MSQPDAWAGAWGQAWGVSWGGTTVPPDTTPPELPTAGPRRRRGRRLPRPVTPLVNVFDEQEDEELALSLLGLM